MTRLSQAACYILLLCFSPGPLFVCGRSAGEEVDLSGPDTSPLGFSLSTQRLGNLLYLIPASLLHTVFSRVCSLGCSLSSLHSVLAVSPPLPLSPSLPRCLHLSLSYWFLQRLTAAAAFLSLFSHSLTPSSFLSCFSICRAHLLCWVSHFFFF